MEIHEVVAQNYTSGGSQTQAKYIQYKVKDLELADLSTEL